MNQPSLADLLPLSLPAVIVIAPSRRDPKFETQQTLITAVAPSVQERLPAVVDVVFEEGVSAEGRLAEIDGAELRSRLELDDDDFCVALIDARGRVVDRYDAPVKADVLLDLSEGSSSRTRQ
ncbi:MAG: DUF4174 domain-containing protein [Bacteroidota bacterium]